MRAQYFLALLCFLLISYPVQGSVSEKKIELKWKEANQLFREAHTPEDFSLVAAHYEALVADGLINGYLFYNLGNAYLKANKLGFAILNYRRAKNYLGNDPYLEENLIYARSLVQEKVQFSLSEEEQLRKSFFFWHYAWTYQSKFAIFFMTYSIFWILLFFQLCLQFFQKKLPLWPLTTLLGIIALIFGGSIFFQEQEWRNFPPAVLVDSGVVRKGDSDTYDALYEKQEIPSGVEVTIMEKRSSWVKVKLPDGLHGWVKRTSVAPVMVE